MLDQSSKSNHRDAKVRSDYISALEFLKNGQRDGAVKILEMNILEGCSDSMVLLGTIFADGNQEERKRSIDLFRLAADYGNSSGLRNLGYCYAIGLNIEKDKVKGARYYKESAMLGNARSACNLGVMYDYGNGVKQDFDQAFRWYTKSAEGGYSRGMTNLGEYYLWGRGTDKDVPSAIKWFKSSDSPRANFRLYEIYTQEEDFKDPATGMLYLEKSAQLGYSKAIIALARALETVDPERSTGYFLMAARKGNQEAIDYLSDHGIPAPECDLSKRRMKKTK